jgi:hypothetical protein
MSCQALHKGHQSIKKLNRKIEEFSTYQSVISSAIITKQYDLLIPHINSSEWEEAKKQQVNVTTFFFEKLHLSYSGNLTYTLYTEEYMQAIEQLIFTHYQFVNRYLLGDEYLLYGKVLTLDGRKQPFYISILTRWVKLN